MEHKVIYGTSYLGGKELLDNADIVPWKGAVMGDDKKAMALRDCSDLLRMVEEKIGQLLQLARLSDRERHELAGAWDEVVSAKGLMDGMKCDTLPTP